MFLRLFYRFTSSPGPDTSAWRRPCFLGDIQSLSFYYECSYESGNRYEDENGNRYEDENGKNRYEDEN
jgi:hypothetical protein